MPLPDWLDGALAFLHAPSVMFRQPSITTLLLGADVLHAVHHFAIERLCDCDVGRGRGCRSAVPLFLGRLEPNHAAGSELFDGVALSLYPASGPTRTSGFRA
jgi:hypothetical protein